ncbi:hypothetical protein PoB_000315200 [Plakobranchus ocellatus]|uniref:Uncharacterized protein n=1 Tax=Plakobranchus ocellatus TaxID=259542 RepID=A0AAV3Y2H9_9GAST|nr:hypothetical protein PoB_000315200 [Plakobranchus ocellatus]
MVSNADLFVVMIARGQWSPPSPGPVPKASSSNNSKCHSLLQRAYDLQQQQQQQQRGSKDKEKQQRPVSSDDSVVFAASRSSQQAAIRHSTAKRRGDSFK